MKDHIEQEPSTINQPAWSETEFVEIGCEVNEVGCEDRAKNQKKLLMSTHLIRESVVESIFEFCEPMKIRAVLPIRIGMR